MSKVDITGTKLVWFGKDNVVFQSRSVTNKWGIIYLTLKRQVYNPHRFRHSVMCS